MGWGVTNLQNHRYEAVIGLEVHCQLALRTKLFSSVAAPARHQLSGSSDEFLHPNSLIDEVTLALPGSLPVLNEGAIDKAALLGLALGSRLQSVSSFARKHYFYPDLPKGYQITQFERPICRGGAIVLSSGQTVRIERIQIEEDAGKTLHENGESLVDFNRAGVALVEIVSEPDIRSAAEAAEYFRALHRIAVYYGVSEGDLERGNFRADANISIRPVGATFLGVRTEIKNLNSFRFLERAVELEIGRQIQIIESGGEVEMETRGYDASRDATFRMRKKEVAQDYRYFPDPDLPLILLSEGRIERLENLVRSSNPFQVKSWLESEIGLSSDDADIVAHSHLYIDFFRLVCAQIKVASPKFVGSFLSSTLFRDGFQKLDLLKSVDFASWMAESLDAIHAGHVSQKVLRENMDYFSGLHLTDGACVSLHKWAANQGLLALRDQETLEGIAEALIADFSEQAEDLRRGKLKILSFFLGHAMKRSNGAIDPTQFRLILLKALGLPSDLR